MIIGRRISARLKDARIGISQAELARRVGMSQSAMNSLISGRSRSSTHLHRIARELLTSPAYLSGETDDPDADAPNPPPPPAHHLVLMHVALPPEEALEAMFRGLIRSMPDLSGDDLARELARLLPTGFAQLQGPLRFERRDDTAAPREDDPGQRGADHGRRRA